MRRITSAGIPSFSYMARKNGGSIRPIIKSAAPVLPSAVRVKIYVGMPISAAAPKHMSWRFVRFSATFVLTFVKSRGMLVNAILGKILLSTFCPVFCSARCAGAVTRGVMCFGFGSACVKALG